MKLIKIFLNENNCSNLEVKGKYINNILINGGISASCSCIHPPVFKFWLFQQSEIFLLNHSSTADACIQPVKIIKQRSSVYFDKTTNIETVQEDKLIALHQLPSVYFDGTEDVQENKLIAVHQVNSDTDIKYLFSITKSFYIWNPSRNNVYVKEDIFLAHNSDVISTIKIASYMNT